MQKTELRISERKVEDFLDLHLKVLKGILQGKGFEQNRLVFIANILFS